MGLKQKVKKILRVGFPDASKIEVRENDGVIGIVVSKSFEGLDTIDRQNLVGELLAQHLTKEEHQEVLVVIAATPEEEFGHTYS